MEFACLPRRVAQLVADAGPDVAQLLLAYGFVARAQARVDGRAQVNLARIGAGAGAVIAEVLHVNGAQRGELQRQRLAGLVAGQTRLPANRALHVERLYARCHGYGAQLYQGAAIVEAGLVNLDAFVAERMVDLDARGHLLARRLVVDHHLAGEQLGHAGGIVLNDELLQLHGKRQFLQQHAVGLRQDGRARLRAFGNQQVAAESGITLGQDVLRLDLGNQPAARVGRLAAQPHLRAHDEVAIEQPPQTDQHNGTVCSDVADLVCAPRLGGHHPALALRRLALLQAHLPAAPHQHAADAACCHFGSFALKVRLGLVVKGLQVLHPDVFLVVAQIGQVLGRVACDAQGRADDQEGQDQQEPPSAVDSVELERQKQLGPEGAELVHIVVDRLLLLEHRADDRGNADHRQERDGKTHRRQQLHGSAQRLRTGLDA